ncbi:MAG: DUF72 domain-containing protein [Candidatus Dojkabacteria bacterium]
MKFGRLSNIENIDFTLPKEPVSNEKIFKKSNHAKIFVGAPGWGRPDWIGKIYPKGTKAKDFLSVYSQIFNSIELNSTHYRTPTKGLVKVWYAESAKDFKFSPKVPQAISHYGGLGNNNLIKDFAHAISNFEDKLGLTFLQLSENFSSARFGDLRAFVSLWPKELPIAIELRQESWFQDQKVLDFLEENNVSSIITDVAGRRDVLHMRLTNSRVIVRFVGNNLHKTDFERLEMWAKKIHEWEEKGMEEIYFYLHEPEETVAPEAADHFIKEMIKLGNTNLKRIKFVEDVTRDQVSLM